jgi:hypothetical protein
MLLSLMGLPVARVVAPHLAAGAGRRVRQPERLLGRAGGARCRVLFIFLPLAALPAAPVHALSGLWHLMTTPLRLWRWLTRRHAPASASWQRTANAGAYLA